LTHGAAADLELARACSRGEEAAWEEFGRRYFDVIRAFATRALRGAAGGDLAAEVIADLWQRGKIARFEGRSTLKTWLAAVVAHAASNAASRQRRWVSLETSAAPEALERPAEDRVGRDRLAELLADATARLEPPDRLLLQLYYDQGLTLEEMGRVVRRSKAVLSRRLKRVTAALRADLEARSRDRYGVPSRELAGGLEAGEIDLGALLAPQQSSENGVLEKGERA
jgi:RNA polymerase sigma-70 factor (ECF subfamily)